MLASTLLLLLLLLPSHLIWHWLQATWAYGMSEEVAEVSPTGYLPMHYRRIRLTSNGVTALADRENIRESAYENGVKPEEDEPRMPEDGEDTSEPWATLWDSMHAFDTENVHQWREDMKAIMLFAGLLSIAIGIFAVNAQQLLSEDSQETSVILLSQIVSLLASPDAHAAVPATDFLPTFSPSEVAVKINTLWVISLTLSLIVAFFAITVQQWLQRVPVLRQMSIRESVRQRQFRYLGLRSWQVHTIISFLPAVLQVAIVLFLVGLVYLLQALNHSVLVAYTIVAGIALLLYLVSAIVPAIFPQSPYKSLFLPAVLTIIRAVAVPLILLILGILLIGTYILGPFFSLVRMLLSCTTSGRWGSYRLVGAVVSFRTTLKGWARRWTSFTVSDLADLDRFWASRERSAMWTPRRGAQLDRAALAWAPWAVPQCDLAGVAPCFRDLEPYERTRAALEWAGMHLGNFGWHDMHDYSQYSFVNPAMLPRVPADGGVFARQHGQFLLDALPRSWAGGNYVSHDPAIAGILTLLFETVMDPETQHLDDAHAQFLAELTGLLVDVRNSQLPAEDVELPVAHFATTAARIPTSLLFKCCALGKHTFTRQGALDAVSWARMQLSGAAALGEATRKRHTMNILELAIGSSATALMALTQHPSLISEQETQPLCRSFFVSLARLLERSKNEIRLTASVCAARPAGTVHVVFRDALVSLSKSLITLLENDYIPMGDNCPSGPLYGRLLDVCRDEAAFNDAMPTLQQFYDILMNRRVPDMPLTGLTPGPGLDRDRHAEDASEKGRSLPDIPAAE